MAGLVALSGEMQIESLIKSDKEDLKRRDLKLTKISALKPSKEIEKSCESEHVCVALHYDELTLGVKC